LRYFEIMNFSHCLSFAVFRFDNFVIHYILAIYSNFRPVDYLMLELVTMRNYFVEDKYSLLIIIIVDYY